MQRCQQVRGVEGVFHGTDNFPAMIDDFKQIAIFTAF
jgi:hypothetical protein